MIAAADDEVTDAEVDGHGALRLPHLRLLLRHVHRQFHELPDRGAGPGAARQRHRRRHPRRPQGAVPRGRPHRSSTSPGATTSTTTTTVLPRSIATFEAFENAMALDIAMGGSTNTVLHLLAAAQEGEVDFTMADIDRLSRRVPVLCKVAPSVADVHIEDVHRAGGIFGILGELDRAGLINRDVATVHAPSLGEALDALRRQRAPSDAAARVLPRRARRRPHHRGVQPVGALRRARHGPRTGRHPRRAHAFCQDGGLAVLFGNIAEDGCIVKTAGVDAAHPRLHRPGADLREPGRRGRRASSAAGSSPATWC